VALKRSSISEYINIIELGLVGLYVMLKFSGKERCVIADNQVLRVIAHTHTHTHTHIHTHAHVHACAHKHAYTCMHTRTYTQPSKPLF